MGQWMTQHADGLEELFRCLIFFFKNISLVNVVKNLVKQKSMFDSVR